MGDGYMKKALSLAVERDLSGSATRLYLVVARVIRDEDNSPTWWEPRAKTAMRVNLSERAVDRAWAELIDHGLARRTVTGAPGRAANYALVFQPVNLTEQGEDMRRERRTIGARTSHDRGANVAPKNQKKEPEERTRTLRGARFAADADPFTPIALSEHTAADYGLALLGVDDV